MNTETIAGEEMLKRAVKCDELGLHYTARYYYFLGVRTVVALIDDDLSKTKDSLILSRMEEYTKRAMSITETLYKHITNSHPETYIQIPKGKEFCSYESIFGKYMSPSVREVVIEEPMLQTKVHFDNLILFLEFLILNCKKLHFVELHTCEAQLDCRDQQIDSLEDIRHDMAKLNRIFSYHFERELRETRLILGGKYVFRLEKHGLHYLEAPPNTLRLRHHSQRLRKAKNMSIAVFRIE